MTNPFDAIAKRKGVTKYSVEPYIVPYHKGNSVTEADAHSYHVLKDGVKTYIVVDSLRCTCPAFEHTSKCKHITLLAKWRMDPKSI